MNLRRRRPRAAVCADGRRRNVPAAATAALLLLYALPATSPPSAPPATDADLPDCADSGGTAVTDKIPVQRMHPPAPPVPGDASREPYTQLPEDGTVPRLDVLSFTYDNQLATLDRGPSASSAEPWIVDFYAHSPHAPTANSPRVSEQDEAAFSAAATVLRGVCSFAVCELSTVVQMHPRAFPGYPCVSLYAETNAYMGRMIGESTLTCTQLDFQGDVMTESLLVLTASVWQGNRTLLGLVESCMKSSAGGFSTAQLEVVAERLENVKKTHPLLLQPPQPDAATPKKKTPRVEERGEVYELKTGKQRSWEAMVLRQDVPTLVMFYAPWCGHCKALSPVFAHAAKEFREIAKFVAVDATVDRTMWGKDHGIDGFPTLKLYSAGSKRVDEGTLYTNTDKDTAHTMVGLSAFIGHHHRARNAGSDDDDSEVPYDEYDNNVQVQPLEPPEPKEADTKEEASQGKARGKAETAMKKAVKKTSKGSAGIESICTACYAVADEIELAATLQSAKSKSGHILHEADVIAFLEPLCKTSVRGKYVLKNFSRVWMGEQPADAPSGAVSEWGLSGEVLELGYSHADLKWKAQAEKLWRWCDDLLERMEETLTEFLRKPEAMATIRNQDAGMRSLLCSTHCRGVAIRPRAPPASDPASKKKEEEPAVPPTNTKTPKKKSKRSRQRELEVITDEDISTVSEVSPGVFVDIACTKGFDKDRIAAYMRGDPDELDVLVCHMEDLFAQRRRATGDDKKCAEIDAAIERLKDVPVQTWSFGAGSGDGSAGRSELVNASRNHHHNVIPL